MNVKALLREEIENEFLELRKMDLGTEKYDTTVNGITKLVDKTIELEKLENDTKDKNENREYNQRDQSIKNYIAIAGIVIPSIITIWGTLKSFKFEQEGTIRTIMGRGFINKLLPKK